MPPPTATWGAIRSASCRGWHQAAGLHLHAHTATPGWLGERLDVGYAIDVMHPRAIAR